MTEAEQLMHMCRAHSEAIAERDEARGIAREAARIYLRAEEPEVFEEWWMLQKIEHPWLELEAPDGL